MCALAKGNLIPGASSQFEAGLPHYVGRYDGRGVGHGSPTELSRATRLSRPARPVSDQRHFVALSSTLSRDTTKRGRKRLFNATIYALRMRVERTFAWEDKFKRLLLRFERIQQRHYGMKLLAYTLINLRKFCGT